MLWKKNSSSSILETKIQICLGPDSPWAKFALAQLLTDLKKKLEMNFKSNHFQIKNENQLTMDFTRNEFKIKTNSNWK
jgi:hypothetical protein